MISIRIPADQGQAILLSSVLKVDRETGEILKSKSGSPLSVVQVALTGLGDQPEVVKVTVPVAEDMTIRAGMPVGFHGLVCRPWSFDGRAGLSWSAEEIGVLPSTPVPGPDPGAPGSSDSAPKSKESAK